MKTTLSILALVTMTACGGSTTSSNFEMLAAVSDNPVFIVNEPTVPTMDNAIFSGYNGAGDPTFISENPVTIVAPVEPIISTTGVIFAEGQR